MIHWTTPSRHDNWRNKIKKYFTNESYLITMYFLLLPVFYECSVCDQFLKMPLGGEILIEGGYRFVLPFNYTNLRTLQPNTEI